MNVEQGGVIENAVRRCSTYHSYIYNIRGKGLELLRERDRSSLPFTRNIYI
jgi:hypothetical protein